MKIKNDNELWAALTRAKSLIGAVQGSPEDCELRAINSAISIYEATRFPIPF